MIDKNLFLHDLSIVAILKNEAPYLKEWLDYHLLAGVDHFYLYDNESSDNQAEVAKPYIEAGLVDYFSTPGKAMQYVVYNDAVKRFKFQSRYMAFIDLDEFIFPKTNQGVVEVVDEILSQDPKAAGLAINWQIFGSNGQEKADYSRGVLERFTRRAPKNWSAQMPSGTLGGNIRIKTLANPRTINFIQHPHYPEYFNGFYSVNENGKVVQGYDNNPVTAEKIVLHHYYAKSLEEFKIKRARGFADQLKKPNRDDEWRNVHDRNEEFDDSILKYCEVRDKDFQFPDKFCANDRLLNALTKNLSPILLPDTPPEFYAGKLETFLTCYAVSTYLKPKIMNDAQTIFFEKASIVAILKALSSGASFGDLWIFLRELSNLLRLPYPIVKELRTAALQIIRQIMDFMRINDMWKDYVELDYIHDLLME